MKSLYKPLSLPSPRTAGRGVRYKAIPVTAYNSGLKNSAAIFAPLSWRFASVLSPPGGERIEERGLEKLAIVLIKLL